MQNTAFVKFFSKMDLSPAQRIKRNRDEAQRNQEAMLSVEERLNEARQDGGGLLDEGDQESASPESVRSSPESTRKHKLKLEIDTSDVSLSVRTHSEDVNERSPWRSSAAKRGESSTAPSSNMQPRTPSTYLEDVYGSPKLWSPGHSEQSPIGHSYCDVFWNLRPQEFPGPKAYKLNGESGTLVEGYLSQRRHGEGIFSGAPYFKRRYYIVKGDFIYRYDSDQAEAKMQGTPLPIQDIRIFGTDTPNVMTIITSDGRSYDLRFSSESERERWTRIIFEAASRCIPLHAERERHLERWLSQSPTTRQANVLAMHMVEAKRGPLLGMGYMPPVMPPTTSLPESSVSPPRSRNGPAVPYVGQILPRHLVKARMRDCALKRDVKNIATLYGGGKYTPHR